MLLKNFIISTIISLAFLGITGLMGSTIAGIITFSAVSVLVFRFQGIK